MCIVDASNLKRNLYLVSQALELGRPLLIVLNKMDIASERHVTIDVAELRNRLGVPVIEMQAHRRLGLEQLKQTLSGADSLAPPRIASSLPAAFCQEVAQLKQAWDRRSLRRCAALSRGTHPARYERVSGACWLGRG